MAARKLLVLANPYAAIDHDGVPAGAFPADPLHVSTRQAHVASEIDRENTETGVHPDVIGNPLFAEATDRSAPQTTRWKFHPDPVELPDTPHYRYGLRGGDLIPCDAYSARAAGQAEFKDPYLALAEKRADAITAWKAEHPEEGEPPFVVDPALDPWAELADVSKAVLEARAAAAAEAKKRADDAAAKAKAAAESKKKVDAKAQALSALGKTRQGKKG